MAKNLNCGVPVIVFRCSLSQAKGPKTDELVLNVSSTIEQIQKPPGHKQWPLSKNNGYENYIYLVTLILYISIHTFPIMSRVRWLNSSSIDTFVLPSASPASLVINKSISVFNADSSPLR